MKNLSNTQKRIIFGLFALFGLSAIINQKETPKTNVSAATEAPASNSTQFIEQTPTKIIDASVGFLIANSAGQTAHFGNDTGLSCSVSWQMDTLDPQAKKAITIKSSERSNQKASIECYYKKEYFVESSKHKTGYEVSIIENNPKNKTADLLVDLKLVSLKSVSDTHPKYLIIKPSRVAIPANLYSKIF
jgi:hypothetical protein